MAIKINKEEKKWLKEFSRRLKKRMKELKMSQTELAERAGVTQGAVSSWINVKSVPLVTHTVRVARILDLEIRDLIDF